MPYTAEISRKNPMCFLFLIDRSRSMNDLMGDGSGIKKADFVADAVNKILNSLTIKCSKNEGIRDYFHIGVIGYGEQVGPVLGGALTGRVRVPVREIADNPLRVEKRTKKVSDGAGGLVELETKFPVWFDSVADGATPMCQALNLAGETLNDFITQFPDSFPSIILHITDGEATDGDPEPIAANLRNLTSSDGNILLLNSHVSSVSGQPTRFPENEQGLPDNFAKLLFRMSSRLPPMMLPAAREMGDNVNEESRGFVFNADARGVVEFLDVGTRVGSNMR